MNDSSQERPMEDEKAGEEPTTSGTMFVMLLFMMALVGLWVLMYMILLGR